MRFPVLALSSSAHLPARPCAGSMRNTRQQISIKLTKPRRQTSNKNISLPFRKNILSKSSIAVKRLFMTDVVSCISIDFIRTPANVPLRRFNAKYAVTYSDQNHKTTVGL